jgi:hypothetical protein
LGAVATALGSIGAEINLVEIVEKGDIEVDEFILELPESQGVESIVTACDALQGVQVQWIRNYARGGNIELDIQVHERMAADPPRAAETFVAAAPAVFRARWGLLLGVTAPEVRFSTPGAPDLDAAMLARFLPFHDVHRVALEDGWLPGWGKCSAVVAPIGPRRAVVVGRPGDPPFLTSEVARLQYLVGSASGVGGLDHDAPSAKEACSGHRSPLADPLYHRS